MSQSHNDNEEHPRVWLCDCGRVHVETNHFRLSFTPDDFLIFLRRVVWTKEVQPNVADLAGETGSDGEALVSQVGIQTF
jgi:hypothetical protein